MHRHARRHVHPYTNVHAELIVMPRSRYYTLTDWDTQPQIPEFKNLSQ